MLHIIFQLTPSVLARILVDDSLLFLDNAVFTLLKNSRYQETLSGYSRLYVLKEQLAARGILPQDILAHIQIIDYAQFVELSSVHPQIHSWT